MKLSQVVADVAGPSAAIQATSFVEVAVSGGYASEETASRAQNERSAAAQTRTVPNRGEISAAFAAGQGQRFLDTNAMSSF